VGYKLKDLGLSFDQPAQPLGKGWSSKCIYPLITPLFHNTQHVDTKALIHAWRSHWHSVHQFDHGLKACSTIAVNNDPIDQGENPLATQPLWMPKTGNNVVLLPPENGAAVYLAGEGPWQRACGQSHLYSLSLMVETSQWVLASWSTRFFA